MPIHHFGGGLTTLQKLRMSFAALTLAVAAGMFGFMYREDMSSIEALYMTVIALSTVGFGEVWPLHEISGLFVIVLILSGVGLAGIIATLAGQIVSEGHFKELVSRRKMEQRLERLNDLFIIAGYGRVGRQMAQEFSRRGAPFAVVEQGKESADKCASKGFPVVLGDAADEEVLQSAGIDRAKTLVTTLSDDEQNAYLTLTARKLRPDLTIIARADFEDSEKSSCAPAQTWLSYRICW